MWAILSSLCLLAGIWPRPSRPEPPAQPAPRVLRVPEAYPSIQVAIDSARRGDTVLVAPGRYYENIRLRGRSIVLTSRYAYSGEVQDIARTIIDGSRPRHPDTASVIRLVNQEDSSTVIEGFTITGGRGTLWMDAKDQQLFREGGGILCELSSPTIRFNYIVGNQATDTSRALSAGGGGIRCGYAEPTIEGNVIQNNRGRYGAGVVLFHSAGVIRNNLILDNVGGEDFGGGGLWIVGALSYRLAHLVKSNTIVGNRAVRGGREPRGPVPALNGIAGGVWTSGVLIEFGENIVWGNSQATGDQFDFTPEAGLRLGRNLVQGGINGASPDAGGETFDADPQFVDRVRFQLAAGSPARNGAVQLGAYGGGASVSPPR